MANVTTRAQTSVTPWGDDKVRRPLAATAATYYPGTLIALDASGNAVKCDDTAAIKFDGINAESVNITVNSGDSAGDRTILVERPMLITIKTSGAAAGDEGKPVYALYDDEVTQTAATNSILVGWIDKVHSATSVSFRPAYAGERTLAQAAGGGPVTVASANGAITAKSGTVAITKGTAAALTIADPVSGSDDGKILRIVSTTAAAHTVSNAAGSGFNAGGASSDVGTFGGAIGDNLVLIAYGGKWLVLSKTNVTLA